MAVTIDRAAVDRYMRGPDVRRTMQRAVDVGATSARRYVGYSRPDPLGRPRRYPKHLRDTIYGRLEVRQGRLVGVIGANHPIAKLHHDPTKAHVIRPRKPGGRLVFMGRSGKVVRARQVRHPGTPGSKYLSRALVDVGKAFR